MRGEAHAHIARVALALLVFVLVHGATAASASASKAEIDSEDGKILFDVGGNGVTPRWFIVRPTGGSRRTFLEEGWARLSPDGTKIAFACSLKLCVSAANGSHRRVIASPSGRERLGLYAGTIAWSPDGRRIAFSSRQGVWTIAPDGSARRLIVPLRKVTATALAWSPTGRAIAFARNLALNRGPLLGQFVSGHIYVVNANGSRLRRLANFGFAGSISWSPNGRSLVWSGGRSPGPMRIFSMDLVTGKSIRLATGDQPMFSPDGRKIVFQRLVRGSFMVAVMGGDGTGAQTLGFGGAPVWSPDGLRIAFSGDQAVSVMAADGTRRRIVARAPGDVGTVQWTRG